MNTPQRPAYLQRSTAPSLTNRVAGLFGTMSPPFVSIMGGRFTLVDAVGNEDPVDSFDKALGPYLDCVIVDVLERVAKIFYDKPFDPNQSQYEPPACWSDNGVAPSVNAARPQSPTCASCPNNVWGSKTSKVSGRGIKACADYAKLALVIPGDDVTFLLRIPPNTLRNWGEYLAMAKKADIDVKDVVTRIWFEQGVLGTLKFKALGYIDEATTNQRDKVLEGKLTDALVGRNDVARPVLSALPTGTAAIPATLVSPQAAPAPAPAPAAAATPAEQQPTGRRRRRSSGQQPPAEPTTAPFRPQPMPVAQGEFMPPSEKATVPPGAAFGIQAGVEPNAELKTTLDGLFGQQQ